LIQQYPEIVALIIASAGFFVAFLVSRGAALALDSIEHGLDRHGAEPQIPANRTNLIRLVYYIVLGFFLLLAVRSLGVNIFGEWLDLVIVYIPRALLGAVIILVGYLLAILARSLVANLMPESSSQLLPQLTQYLVIIVAVVTGLGQMAIDVSFIATLTLLIVGLLLGSLSLAFALGSRDLVANLLARREVSRFQIGDHLQVHDVAGQLIEITRTGIILESQGQRFHIPAAQLNSSIVIQGEAPRV